MKHTKIMTLGVVLLVLSGCSLSPRFETPTLNLPSPVKEALHVNETWWESFHDTRLNTLLEEALHHNDDVKLSALRILKAKQSYGLSDAALYPTIQTNATSLRQKNSDKAYQSKSGTFSDTTLGLNLSYEIDFWGKLHDQRESNWELFLANRANARIVRNTLIHEFISTYFTLISLRERLDIATQQEKVYEVIYRLRQTQYDKGTINAVVLQQAHANYLSLQGTLVSLRETIATQESALMLLLGKEPQKIVKSETLTHTQLVSPLVIPQGIPSNLLENRPDISEALHTLKSKYALIGVEKSAYFPTISLSGSYGYQSQSTQTLFDAGASRWSVGPSLIFPLFDFGRIKTRVEISETEKESARIAYEQKVKKAYKEVYDALIRHASLQEKWHLAQEETNAYAQAFETMQKRFDVGTISLLDLLESQKSLLNMHLSRVNAHQLLLIAQAELFKTLGGGWRESTLIKDPS